MTTIYGVQRTTLLALQDGISSGPCACPMPGSSVALYSADLFLRPIAQPAPAPAAQTPKKKKKKHGFKKFLSKAKKLHRSIRKHLKKAITQPFKDLSKLIGLGQQLPPPF